MLFYSKLIFEIFSIFVGDIKGGAGSAACGPSGISIICGARKPIRAARKPIRAARKPIRAARKPLRAARHLHVSV